jgi:predicted transcriptional regulator
MQQKKSPESTPEKEQAQAREIILGEVQEHFAELVWANEPIASGDLVRLCEKELKWKKPTTYTVLRKLCEKGLMRNDDGVVTTLMTREDFYSAKSEQIVEDSYEGSLPAFIAAFTSRKKLSSKEVDEIQQMIDRFRKDKK